MAAGRISARATAKIKTAGERKEAVHRARLLVSRANHPERPRSSDVWIIGQPFVLRDFWPFCPLDILIHQELRGRKLALWEGRVGEARGVGRGERWMRRRIRRLAWIYKASSTRILRNVQCYNAVAHFEPCLMMLMMML